MTKLFKKISILLLITSFLVQNLCWAGDGYYCLAPYSVFPAKDISADKFQLLAQRFIRNNPEYANIPIDRFESFFRSSEAVFRDYLVYSRFPYNAEVAVQFVEGKRALIREIQRLYIETLAHFGKKEALKRREGITRLEEMVQAKLDGYDYSVVNLMGRPGAGKSTFADKIKKGFVSLKPNEIFVISVDAIRDNDISILHQRVSP